MAKERGRKVIAQNRKARHDFTIEDVYEAGMVLVGTEVKSLRAGRASLVDGYALFENGEIWLRGVSLMDGYWHADPAQRKPLADQWFQTGDIGILDADGYLWVVDRIKDVINRAGEKIASASSPFIVFIVPGT